MAGTTTKHLDVIGWSSLKVRAAAIAILEVSWLFPAQSGNPDSAAVIQAAPTHGNPTPASGTLRGAVTLTCSGTAVGCSERPYQVPLLLRRNQGDGLPQTVPVSGAGKFSIDLPPGTYTIASGDVRGACCLPILDPISATIASGRTTEVSVRFEPGLQLPTR